MKIVRLIVGQRFWLVVLLIIWISSCKQGSYKYPTLKILTDLGDIEIELYPGKAPKTAAAFLNYVDSGLFKNSSFYRVLNDENQSSAGFKSQLIQGGIWESNNKKAVTLPGIEHENTKTTDILHKDGVISLARSAPGTANTEFFICLGDQAAFDYGGSANSDGQGFAAFGKVIKGMNVVRLIHTQPENNESIRPPVSIKNIIRLK